MRNHRTQSYRACKMAASCTYLLSLGISVFFFEKKLKKGKKAIFIINIS